MGFYLDRAAKPTPAVQGALDDDLPPPLTAAAAEPSRGVIAAPAVSIAVETATVSGSDPPAPLMPPPATERIQAAEPAAAPPVAIADPPCVPTERVTTAALATIEPQAGSSTTTAAPTPIVAAAAGARPLLPHLDSAGYWVEYAVFSRERSAQRLRQALAALHLETTVVATHAPNGRRLWRVRSAMQEDHALAQASAQAARQKLRIEPLIHRGSPSRAPHSQYWVQFGAFPTYAPAVKLRGVLADNGVKATIRTARTTSGKQLFLVRSEGFPNRKLAMLVGELGANAAKVAFTIGRSPRGPPHVRRASGDHAAGSSLPRQQSPHRHRPPPGG